MRSKVRPANRKQAQAWEEQAEKERPRRAKRAEPKRLPNTWNQRNTKLNG